MIRKLLIVGMTFLTVLSCVACNRQEKVTESSNSPSGVATGSSSDHAGAKNQDRLFPVVKNGKWGFIDNKGNVIIKPQFDGAYKFAEGLGPVLIGEKWGYIDRTGKPVIKPQYDGAQSFSEGLAGVTVTSDKGPKVGYIDKTGKMIIQPEFDGAYEFCDGLGPVVTGGKWGYVDQSGKYVWDPSR